MSNKNINRIINTIIILYYNVMLIHYYNILVFVINESDTMDIIKNWIYVNYQLWFDWKIQT